jgi:hypothetical protein
MPDEFAALADRYREIANVVRAAVPAMRSAEARGELAALASDYENLASYVESCRNYELDDAELAPTVWQCAADGPPAHCR